MIPPHRRNVVLIGMMGSGKTTIGRHVARRLGRPFTDTDRIIRGETGRSIPELFAERGEDGFRELETAVIERVAAVPHQIIAVGGGAVCRQRNVDALRSTGDLILLDASLPQLAGRISRGAARGSRPLLGPAESDAAERRLDDDVLERLARLWGERQPLYEAAAVHRVDSGHRPPAIIGDEIVAWLAAHRSPGKDT